MARLIYFDLCIDISSAKCIYYYQRFGNGLNRINRRAEMKTFETAKEAIQHSIEFDTIAFCENTDENKEYLSSECDDWTDSNEGYEYWADAEDSDGTDGKMEWRVHVITNE